MHWTFNTWFCDIIRWFFSRKRGVRCSSCAPSSGPCPWRAALSCRCQTFSQLSRTRSVLPRLTCSTWRRSSVASRPWLSTRLSSLAWRPLFCSSQVSDYTSSSDPRGWLNRVSDDDSTFLCRDTQPQRPRAGGESAGPVPGAVGSAHPFSVPQPERQVSLLNLPFLWSWRLLCQNRRIHCLIHLQQGSGDCCFCCRPSTLWALRK